MPDYPITEEALEAAALVLVRDRLGRDRWQPTSSDSAVAQTAINAFLAAEGFEVERADRVVITEYVPGDWRLVGPWRSSEGQ